MTALEYSEQDFLLGGQSLRVRSGGQGRPVVHLHSAAGPRRSSVIDMLASHHLVHCPCAPGFDGRPGLPAGATLEDLADLVGKFITQECGGACDLIGESFGGWIAMWVAIRHPDLVQQLVLEAPAGLRPDGLGGLGDSPAERLRRLYANPGKAPLELRTEAIQMANRKAVLGYSKGVSFDEALAANLPMIKARTLIVMGAQDGVIPPETGRLLKVRISQSHLIYVHGAAHVLEVDQPDRVGRLILDFLDRGESFMVRESKSA